MIDNLGKFVFFKTLLQKKDKKSWHYQKFIIINSILNSIKIFTINV